MAGHKSADRYTVRALQNYRTAKPPPVVIRFNADRHRCRHPECQGWLNGYRPCDEDSCGVHRYCVVCSAALVPDELEQGVCAECAQEARKEQASVTTG